MSNWFKYYINRQFECFSFTKNEYKSIVDEIEISKYKANVSIENIMYMLLNIPDRFMYIDNIPINKINFIKNLVSESYEPFPEIINNYRKKIFNNKINSSFLTLKQ